MTLDPRQAIREFEVFFPRRLLAVRKRLALHQEELSRRMNIPRGTYASYETGKRAPNIYAVAKIALAMGVELRELMPPKLSQLDSYDPLASTTEER